MLCVCVKCVCVSVCACVCVPACTHKTCQRDETIETRTHNNKNKNNNNKSNNKKRQMSENLVEETSNWIPVARCPLPFARYPLPVNRDLLSHNSLATLLCVTYRHSFNLTSTLTSTSERKLPVICGLTKRVTN